MNRFVFGLTLLLVLPLAQALTLEEALARAASRPDAITAQLELLMAESDWLRVQSDPLALRLDELQAEQAVTLGRAELRLAFYRGLLEIAQAYTGVLQARQQLELAETGLELNRSSLDIARIRLANGSATELDVREAEVALDEAEQNVAAAASGLAVAESNLAGMIGQEVEASALEPVSVDLLVALPELELALEAAAQHPQLLQSQQGLELARASLDVLDPSYASAAQLEAARTRLRTTERLVAEAERGFALQVRNLYLQAETAAESYRVAQEALENARGRFEVEQDRFEAGLIARIQVQQAELSVLQAEFEAQQARHAYLSALLELQQGALVQLPGPEVLDFQQVQARLAEEAQSLEGEGSDGD